MSDPPLSLLAHLEELRRRLIIAACAWGNRFSGLLLFSESCSATSRSGRAALRRPVHWFSISATEPFFTYLKIAAFAGLLAACR